MTEKIVLTAVLLAGIALSLRFFLQKISYLTIARPSDRLGDYGKRFGVFLKRVMGQYYLFRRPVTGTLHAVVFWGFCAFVLGTINHVVEGYGGIHASIFFGSAVGTAFYAFLDVVALLVTVAILGLAFRRYVLRPDALTYPSPESAVIIFFIFTLMVTFFLTQAFKFNMDPGAFHEQRYMLVSGFLARVVPGWGVSAALGYKVMWWAHLLIILAFACYIPNSKHMHLAVCPVNEFLCDLGPRGVQEKIDIDLEADELPDLGKSRYEQFPWHHLLDLYACVECGRCQDFCPAYASGKPLNPKFVILDMKHDFLETAPALLAAKKAGKPLEEVERKALVGEVIEADRIWDCTTCYACQEMCPVGNEHPQKLLEMRRYLTMEEEQAPAETATLFRNLENQSNPWGLSRAERAAFLEGLDVPRASGGASFDYLLWIGCSGSYDQRAQKAARALVRVLQAAGVSFAVLGEEEGCCGDPARRLGNELMFQMQAEENIETLNGYGVKRIITFCPHGFHTLAYEYPQLGGNYEVVHYTVFLSRLLAEGRLKLKAPLSGEVTYHDSCYLCRYHGVEREPRELVRAAGKRIVEMERSGVRSFCCGGGGGRMFLEEDRGERINRLRTDQIKESGAPAVVVNCPFCLTMIEDGIKERDYTESLTAVELSELILEALGKED